MEGKYRVFGVRAATFEIRYSSFYKYRISNIEYRISNVEVSLAAPGISCYHFRAVGSDKKNQAWRNKQFCIILNWLAEAKRVSRNAVPGNFLS